MRYATIKIDVSAYLSVLTLILASIRSLFDDAIHACSESQCRDFREQSLVDVLKYMHSLLGLSDVPEKLDAILILMEEELHRLLGDDGSVSLVKHPLMVLEKDIIGDLIQKTLNSRSRKQLAAHFTNAITIKRLIDREDLLSYLVSRKSIIQEDQMSSSSCKERSLQFLDPFAGSGRLLMAVGFSDSLNTVIESSISHGVNLHFKAIELYPLSAMGCYLNLLLIKVRLLADVRSSFRDHGLKVRITVRQGDAFDFFASNLIKDDHIKIRSLDHFLSSYQARKSFLPFIFGEHDLVIMNPPYTRYGMLEPSYRDRLKKMFVNEEKLFDSHAGLHVYSLFLGEKFLREGGMLLAVLPASLLHARYAWKLKRHYLQHYQVVMFCAFSSSKAFSDDSEFREIILLMRKDGRTTRTKFVIIDPNSNFHQVVQENVASSSELSQHWNWLTFFMDENTYRLFKAISRSRYIITTAQLGTHRLVRGFEMYGPEFFFIPNKYWNLLDITRDKVIITPTESAEKVTSQHFSFQLQELELPRAVFRPSLRKPGLYSSQITPIIKHWVFMPRNDYVQLDGVKEYIEWGRLLDLPAIKNFGLDWPTHIYRQVSTKKPVGRVFTPDKISLSSHGTLVHYLDESTLSSKNFYVFVPTREWFGHPNLVDLEKLLAAWMSSTLFVFLNLSQRREVGGSLGRLQIIDYIHNPLLLDISSFYAQSEKNERIKDEIASILTVFDEFRMQRLEPLSRQLNHPLRAELDDHFVNLLRQQGVILTDSEEIVESVQRMLRDLVSRDH